MDSDDVAPEQQLSLRVLGDDAQERKEYVLRAYLGELQRQAQFALKALDDVLTCGASSTTNDDFDTWYAAQALLTALGIIRRILLGDDIRGQINATKEDRVKAKKRGVDRGLNLREMLGMELGTVLLSADVRNAFEHFDERLDQATAQPYMIDTAIYKGPNRMRYYADEDHVREIEPLRQLDVSSGHLIFRSDALDLFAVRHDLRLLSKHIGKACEHPREPAQVAVGVFGHAVQLRRTDADGKVILGDPFPEDPDM
jgi:hypothetical protein